MSSLLCPDIEGHGLNRYVLGLPGLILTKKVFSESECAQLFKRIERCVNKKFEGRQVEFVVLLNAVRGFWWKRLTMLLNATSIQP